MANDPRKEGFNYGAPLPIPAGLGIYDDAMRLSERLNDVARQASQRAWALDMAIRDVRHACSAEERAFAMQRLTEGYADLVRFSPVKPEDPTPNYSHEELANVGELERHLDRNRGWPK